MMGFFEAIGKSIGRRAAQKAVGDYFASDAFEQSFNKAIDDVIVTELRKPRYAWFRFVKKMQAEMLRIDPKMEPRTAFHAALNAYKTFLHDEKIEFGDPRYDWTAGAARDLAHAYEIDHWEGRPA